MENFPGESCKLYFVDKHPLQNPAIDVNKEVHDEVMPRFTRGLNEEWKPHCHYVCESRVSSSWGMSDARTIKFQQGESSPPRLYYRRGLNSEEWMSRPR